MSSFNDIWYNSRDGLKLYAREYPNDPSERTILCMHGLSRNASDFEVLAPALQALGQVVCVDQRGRGNSSFDPNPAKYTIKTYVDDMFCLIEHLKLNNIVLVGTSMGGVMSMLMVAMKPELFTGVVLNDLGPEVGQAGLDRIKSYVGKSNPVETLEDAIAEAKRTSGDAHPEFTDSDWARWVPRLYDRNADGTFALRYDPAISQPLNEAPSSSTPNDPWPLFDGMTNLPLLTIRGELSDILSMDCVDEMARRHPDMELLIVDNVGHAPELHEPGVVDAITQFISAL
jgi:pimeloyl-ACP methyl ester carboxylesterase